MKPQIITNVCSLDRLSRIRFIAPDGTDRIGVIVGTDYEQGTRYVVDPERMEAWDIDQDYEILPPLIATS